MSDNPDTLKNYRVTVIEWLSHCTNVQAIDRDSAIELARELWLSKENDDRFAFEDSDLDTVIADEC